MHSHSNHDDSMKQPLLAPETPQDCPPSYDVATDSGSSYSPQGQHHQPAFIKVNAVEAQQVYVNPQAAGPSYTSQPIPTPAPTVYNYVNPLNGEQIVSLLPPNHPEMVCLQAGGHVTETNYGILGILAAVFWFPLGIGLCLLDRHVKCRRCGAVLNEGLCA
ncbi:hypothetical protein BJ165DRAFT_1457192 [Panaeolus papilionaceus]|nr:hypothetical protein BJ165DRAFT_1457192 [Panaeolus papilionaceus]